MEKGRLTHASSLTFQIRKSITLLICSRLLSLWKVKEITLRLLGVPDVVCKCRGVLPRLSVLCDGSLFYFYFFPFLILSYPALHLYLYSFLHWLTEGGKILKNAQAFFALIYLATQFFVMKIYKSAGVSISRYKLSFEEMRSNVRS